MKKKAGKKKVGLGSAAIVDKTWHQRTVSRSTSSENRPTQPRGVFHAGLFTSVRRIEYDFEQNAGFLHLPMGAFCDMSGCVNLFRRIDPGVLVIYTFSGPISSTTYLLDREPDKWRAITKHGYLGKPCSIDDEE